MIKDYEKPKSFKNILIYLFSFDVKEIKKFKIKMKSFQENRWLSDLYM